MAGISEQVAGSLAEGLASRGRALLAVPGGTTPGPFLLLLSDADLDWSSVTVMLTDERIVPPDHERSNARLVRQTLLQNRAAAATFLDYNDAGPDRGETLRRASRFLADHAPIDVLVLGMGVDMHTASLFPDAPQLVDALAAIAPPLVTVRPAGQPEDRLTLSGPLLSGARDIHILINGAEKLAALESALQEGPVAEAPVRVVLRSASPLSVHYAN